MSLRRSILAVLTASAIALAGMVVPAFADGTPDIDVQKDMPAEALYGEPVPVTITASNDTSTDGYNLSYRDVLPAGVDFQNAAPAPDQVLEQADGTTVLIWSNTSDLLAGTTASISYEMVPDTGEYTVGGTISNSIGAFVSSEARTLPRFSAGTGIPVAGSYTGSAATSAETELIPFRITKAEPSEELELVRGVHEHQTVYTITVENNPTLPSTDFSVVDYLPAGLEFLGCGAVDNSAPEEFEEYPGAGRINPGNEPTLANPCPVPSSVTTVTVDPDAAGPMASGVYTRVEWDSASLAAVLGSAALGAGESFEFDYIAAVPLRANVQAELDDPTANLDNNTGALTADEQALTNGATASGTTGGADYTDDTTLTVTAEDIAIAKTVDSEEIAQGGTSVWTLHIRSSEYATETDTLVVTDTIPDGLDFASASPAPVSVDTQTDGTLLVTWELAGFTGPSSETTIELITQARANYRVANEAGPVSSNDSWTNTTDIATTGTVITDNDGTTTALELVDDSQASQSAGGAALDKLVSNPVAGDLDCSAPGIEYAPDLASGPYRPGDRVCWQVVVQFPEALDTLEPELRDFLPAGFTYESWAFGEGNTIPSEGLVFDASQEPVLVWDLSDVDSAGETLVVVVSSRLTAPGVIGNGDVLSNLAKVSYSNSAGDRFQLRDLADAPYVEPQLSLTKSADPTQGVAGDVVTYTITVPNGGDLDATNALIRDLLPPGIACEDVTDLGDAVCTDGTDGAYLQWDGLTVPAQDTITLDYQVTLPGPLEAGTTLTNTAGVRSYENPTNNDGEPFVLVPGDNIDPELADQENTDPATDDAVVTVPGALVDKSVETAFEGAGNAAADQATIGEVVSYTVTATVPEGTQVTDAVLTDALPASLTIVDGSVEYLLDGAALPAGFTTSSDASGFTVTFPTPYDNAAGSGDDILTVTYDVLVQDAAANVRGAARTNDASFVWDGGDADAAATVTVVEPDIAVAKTSDDADGQVAPGQDITYTLTVSNGSGTATSSAYDVVVVDTVPEDVIPLDGDGEPAESGPLPGGGAWNIDTRQITWVVDEITPNGSVQLTYPARISDPLTGDSELTNEVAATTTSLPGDVEGERDATTDVPGYLAEDSLTLDGPTITTTKSADPESATLGETVTYTLEVGVPAQTRAWDVTVLDTLPAGMAYDDLVSATCEGCDPAIGVTALSATDDVGTIGFFLGDVAQSAQVRTVTIVYTAYVTQDAADGDVLTNGATTYFNDSDVITGTPPEVPEAEDFTDSTEPASTDVDVVEPSLAIDKDVAGQIGDSDTRRAIPGQTLTYTVVVTNTGTSAAYEIDVLDVTDERFGGFADLTDVEQAGGVALSDGDPTDGTLGWSVTGPLDPGASVTITYTLTVPATLDSAAEVVDGPELTNTADVPQYWGVPEDDREPAPRFTPYDDVEPDTVEIELDLASIGDLLWNDLNGDGVIDAGEPVLGGVPVTVTYLGADGVPGGGDDEVHETVTAADGTYLVENLPGGQYLVVVDHSSAAIADAGLAPSYDLDGSTETPNGQWTGALGEDEDKTDVDFGFWGSSAIGDTIWVDADLDGLQDTGESGIPGVTVTVEWGGPDGDLSTTADNATYTAVTDAEGRYRVENLPAGSYRVTVDESTLDASYANVSDPDGTNDGTTELTLGAGAEDLDQDFGYAGSGAIGDTVYLDRDGSGSQDDGEPGLSGVVVELTYTGPNGETLTLTTSTGEDGAYLFENLPAGTYTVTVTGGLPAAVANTGDPDGGNDDTSQVTIGDGASNLDQDFGYEAQSALGDRIWWDLNADGVQDLGEPGIPGVTVQIEGPNGLLLTTVTGADGAYLFVDVPAGDYIVTVPEAPTGFTATYDASGPVDGVSETTLVVADFDQDFGYVGSSSIGDTVWFDRDADGVQSDDEPGLAGVTVQLTYGGVDGDVSTTEDNVVLTLVTDENGNYLFESLPEGSYLVEIDETTLPAGMAATYDLDGGEDSVTAVELPGDTALETVDFGYRGTASIGDVVYLDLDGDGVQGSEEPGLADVVVDVIWAGPDGELGTEDDETFSATTDLDGTYLVEGLPAGDYLVVVDPSTLPGGVFNTADEDGDLDSQTPVTLEIGEAHPTADFGYRGDGVIGDTIYLDLDGDGAQGEGEPGVPAQPVVIVWAGPDGELGTGDDVPFDVVTDADGGYLVEGLPDGPYSVTVDGGIADSAVNTGDPDAGGDATSVLTLDDDNGRENLDQDFGFQGLNALGDTVWWDLNGDGVDDGADEPRLPGVELLVTWFGPDGERGGGDDVAMPTVMTDDTGSYLVGGLPNGTFRVEVAGGVPEGLAPSYDATDTPNGVSVVELDGGEEGAVDLDQDFGYAGSGSIGDTVWLDLDGDGVRDEGEPGIPGALVSLTWGGPDGDLSTIEDNVEFLTNVADDGSYLFDRLPAGAFRVEVVDGLPAGLNPSADPDGGADSTSVLTLAEGEANLNQDFGYTGTAGVGDTIWVDVNGDGAQTGNEPGVPGMPVVITHAGGDGLIGTADDIVIQTVTDDDGRYSVVGLPPGTVQVAYDPAALEEGYQPGSDLDGGSLVVSEVTLGADEYRDDVDFGVIGTASLSGIIWNDADRDGEQDSGERGIPGVTVIVTWHGPDGDVEIPVVTGPDGSWSLENLPPGEYTVRVDLDTVPDGLTASTQAEVSVTLEPGGTGFVEHGYGPQPTGPGGVPLPPTGVMVGIGAGLALLLLLGGALLVVAAQRRRMGAPDAV